MANEDLEQKRRQLNLVLALDDVRDRLQHESDPHTLFHNIATLLKDHFDADASAIMLVAEGSDEVESLAAIGVPRETAHLLCQEALVLPEPGPLQTSLWDHSVGVQILLEEGSAPLGSFFLARKSQPFTVDETALIDLAESQIDSAVIQARLIWKIAHRNRELEAIFQIDRLRDETDDENVLISRFTTVLLEHFHADLCLFLLNRTDDGESILRGIVDKNDLPAATLDSIRDLTANLQSPQTIPAPPGIKDMNLLAAPFIVSGDRLGAVVVGRQTSFSLADNRLMHAVISQMDSAIAHARMSYKLGLRNKELETIYRIDHIRDVEADFDAMLQAVLTELCRVISSEMGYIMLYSADKDEHMEMKASTEDGALTSAEHNRIIKRVSREALDSAQLVCHNQPEGPIQSIVAIPLILNERIIGVFGAINSKNKRGFSPDDRRMLAAITSQVDSAVFERLEQRRIRRVLGRSVDPKVLNYLLQHPDDSILEGERVILSILFADLRGSTEWAERIAAEELVATLNLFLSRMTEVIFSYEGTLDKFVGDEIIALFGTPVHLEDHAYRAASTGLAIQVAHQELQAELSAQGKELPSLGVGISSGEVIAGEFGPAIHTDFTAIGRVMNLGSRLCSAAAAGQVIISPETYRLLGDQAHVETSDSLTLKGISEPIPICHLLALRD